MLCEGVFYMNELRPHRDNRDTHLPPSIAWLKSKTTDASGDRILNIGETGVYPNWGAALSIPQLGDLNSIGAPRWYQDFFYNYVGHGRLLSISAPDNEVTLTDESLSLAGVRYIVIDRTFKAAIARVVGFGYPLVNSDPVRLIYENPHPLPRAFVVRNLFGGNVLPLGVREAITTVDGALVQDARQLGVPIGATVIPGVDASSNVRIIAYHHDLIRVRTALRAASILVLTDAWTPWWSAFLDSRPVHLGRADVTFRAIAVPAGEHIVEFRYVPLALRIGNWITIASAVVVLVILWKWNRIVPSAQ
jgi:post-segregation antitoxin (ccd killing protein)